MELDLVTLGLLGLVALTAGFVDSIAGGGGLLTVPALLLAGFDPVSAVATNKIQGLSGGISATLAFARAGQITWRESLPLAGMAAIGGLVGALTVRHLPGDVLAGAIPILLLGIAVYFGASPKIRNEDARRRVSPMVFGLTVAPLVGFYDGFFGPGAGSFYMVGMVTLLGLGLVRATGNTKLLNLSSNAASLALFIASGLVVWPVGLVMAAGSFTGAQVGSRLALRHGARVIRPLLILVCLAVAARLLADPANPLRHAVARLASTH
ncbi:hypothetical protein SLNSH_16545 [Alsobacter soli]|uniref:Probable membrane transporter protein n=1 Tax=Alsobacter soli TaxID=2109933 RepID=A0A2T1HQE7_9HYPH|nr:TSUP family transporter [Alsobacter soli]PSC03878.1 hypothetical protein SLNSH_16545 [Alsobacter soli]